MTANVKMHSTLKKIQRFKNKLQIASARLLLDVKINRKKKTSNRFSELAVIRHFPITENSQANSSLKWFIQKDAIWLDGYFVLNIQRLCCHLWPHTYASGKTEASLLLKSMNPETALSNVKKMHLQIYCNLCTFRSIYSFSWKNTHKKSTQYSNNGHNVHSGAGRHSVHVNEAANENQPSTCNTCILHQRITF